MLDYLISTLIMENYSFILVRKIKINLLKTFFFWHQFYTEWLLSIFNVCYYYFFSFSFLSTFFFPPPNFLSCFSQYITTFRVSFFSCSENEYFRMIVQYQKKYQLNVWNILLFSLPFLFSDFRCMKYPAFRITVAFFEEQYEKCRVEIQTEKGKREWEEKMSTKHDNGKILSTSSSSNCWVFIAWLSQ